MADLEQRLIAIEIITNPGQPFSIQSVKPWLERNSALRKEASAEITRLRAALADAQEREAHAGKREIDKVLGQFLSALPLDRITTAGDSVGALIDGIKRVVRERDDAHAVGFAAGVEAAAKRCDAIAGNTADFNQYHRRAAGQCGAAIRALTPPDATAAAARVLLPGMEQRHVDHMTSLGRDPEKYTSEYRMAAKALRAIAGDTP